MASVLETAQQRVAHTVEAVRGIGRLRELGLTDPRDPVGTVRTALDGRVFGPPATAIRRAARLFPDQQALADERGTLTYRELEDRSNALARGLQRAGVKPGTVVGVLARDHRGLVLTMSALGKLGARMALMNTGFAKPQFAQVCERENVRVVLHDSEFLGLLDALPANLTRILTWVDEGTEIPSGVTTLDDLIAANAATPLPAPKKAGGFIILTSGTTGLPKGAPRDHTSPLATVQMVDRIDFPHRGTMVIVSPIFHSTGFATWLAGCAFGNKVVVARRFDAEQTLRLIAEHKAEMLVAVPTMLHRMVELDKKIRDKYDTSSLKGIVLAGSALSPSSRSAPPRCSARSSTTCTAPPNARSRRWPGRRISRSHPVPPDAPRSPARWRCSTTTRSASTPRT